MRLKDFLKDYRKKNKLSRLALSEMVDVDERSIENWENGTIPKQAGRNKLFEFFGAESLDKVVDVNYTALINRYIKRNLITKTDFSNKFGFNYSIVCGWCRGAMTPTREKMAIMIDAIGDELYIEDTTPKRDKRTVRPMR